MSTELRPIETKRPQDRIQVTEFFGGVDRGGCLQLTQLIDKEWRYIQLSRPDALALSRRLKNWAKRNEDAEEWT